MTHHSFTIYLESCNNEFISVDGRGTLATLSHTVMSKPSFMTSVSKAAQLMHHDYIQRQTLGTILYEKPLNKTCDTLAIISTWKAPFPSSFHDSVIPVFNSPFFFEGPGTEFPYYGSFIQPYSFVHFNIVQQVLNMSSSSKMKVVATIRC